MELKDKPVYPLAKRYNSEPEGEKGLTYREWLVGMLASNSEVFHIVYNMSKEERKGLGGAEKAVALVLLEQADAIIKALDTNKGE
ncbi:MAG: hypothetical protein GY804_09715 [Alphaproteobacteria bacterium]|nr:hypothetical protein [Alphaproteobacteria bacterium]